MTVTHFHTDLGRLVRAQSATLRFVRGDRGTVTGLVLDAGRVRGIAFTRRER